MTGLPTLLVELDDGTGTFPHDITEYVHLVNGHSITRGRGAEFDTIDASTLTITLRNNQGHFTLGSPTFGTFVDQMIRVTETVGATTSQRFTGYVQNWPTSWASAQASLSLSTVTAVDRLARLERRQLRSMVEREILGRNPVAYYTLGEPAQATSAGDTSGNLRGPLTAAGIGAEPVFGGATGPGVDGLTATQFGGEKYLVSPTFGVPLTDAASLAFFFSVAPGATGMYWLVKAGTPAFLLPALQVAIDESGKVQATCGPWLFGVATSPLSYNDGEVHCAIVTADATTTRLYMDGELVDTAGTPNPPDDLGPIHVGFYSPELTAGISHVAVWDSTLSAADAAAIAAAGLDGFAGESSDARVERLAAYAGLGAGDLDLETGKATVAAQQTSGASVMAALADVATTEGGTIFIDGSGALVFQSRTHRVRSATGAAALELDASDVRVDLTWSADKNYLVNYATGTRPNGAEQSARNQESIDIHEQYPASQQLLVTTDTEVKHALQWQVGNYGEVKPRITQVTVDLLTQPDAAIREAALSLEIGDRITITGMPSQSPVATANLIVEGWTETYSKDEWSLTLNTISADHFKAWVLEDPVYGVLEGPFTRLHY